VRITDLLAATAAPTSPAGDEIVAPAQYSPAWTVFAVFLLALVALVVWWLLRRTRRREEKRTVAAQISSVDALKAEYLRAVDGVRDGVAAGRMTEREAHQRLTEILRRFLRDAAGVDVGTADLALLLADPRTRGIGEVIARLYEPDFARDPDQELGESVRTAREAVRAWS
jgi:hypothetical protein